MRIQQFLPLCGLLLASVAIASKLDHDDVPTRCWPACGSVVGIAKSCDAQHERDSAEIQCICDWDAARTQIPLCSACITQYQADRRNHNITHNDHDGDDDDDDDDDDDNEALDLVHSCSLTTTTYNSAATTVTGTSTTTAGSNTATVTDTSSTSGTNSQDSTTSVSSGSSGSADASSGSASSPTPTPDTAAGISAPSAAYMAGVMGLMAFAWL
ncbi:unnamed protein product [Penicillium crustosum]